MTPDTVVAMFEQRVAESAERPALRLHDGQHWCDLSWSAWDQRARNIASALLDLGHRHGDPVAIVSSSRAEWLLAEMGTLMAGGTVVSVYESNLAEQIAWILADSRARLVFVEDPHQLVKLLSISERLPHLQTIVCFTDRARGPGGEVSFTGALGTASLPVYTLATLEERGQRGRSNGADRRIAERIAATRATATCTILYTSGATGDPKGVVLTHRNLVYQSTAVQGLGLGADDVQLLYLPLAHAFGRTLVTAFIHCGGTMAFARSAHSVLEDAAAVNPTVLAGTSRLFETAFARLVADARAAGGLRQAMFEWSAKVAEEVAAEHERGHELNLALRIKRAAARRAMEPALTAMFGERIRLLISGQAPLSEAIVRYFYGLQHEVLQGYGLTETSGATHVNRPGQVRFGTVGKPLPGVEVRLGDDGEIQVRGPTVMAGYYDQPDATAAAFAPGGWLRTGDVGTLDEDGSLRLLGRRRELISTVGHTVSPDAIENRLQSSPWIRQAFVYGHERDFLTALVTLDIENVGRWAAEHGIAYRDIGDLAAHPAVYALVSDVVQTVNTALPSFEAVRKFALLDRELSQELGELTPTERVRRAVVAERHRDVLDSFYRDQF